MGKKSRFSPFSGFGFLSWLDLLWQSGFAVDLRSAHRAVGITLVSGIHSMLGGIEKLVYGRKIRAVEIDPPPVFIIGHWRTGTTHLHELLALDPRNTYPNTYECFDAMHFVLTEGVTDKLLRWVLPDTRPMDNMLVGFERPQEDEFALCATGAGSPYLRIAFPNIDASYDRYLDLEGLTDVELEKWKAALLDFFKRVIFVRPGRIVVKSPPHTCRVKVLAEMFPEARFVHIVRDPYVVFPSTMHLWKSLYDSWALQRPPYVGLEERVLETFLRFYQKIEEARALLPPSRFFELKYEDLIRDPIGQLRELYRCLALGDFEEVRPKVEEYLRGLAGYKTNKYEISPEMRRKVSERWGEVIRRYGYE